MMIDLLILSASIVALVLAFVAFRAATQATSFARRAAHTAERVRSATRESTRSPDERKHPWRESTQQDAPAWIRHSFNTVYELIQELQRETKLLKAEQQRVAGTAAMSTHGQAAADPSPGPPQAPSPGQAVDLREGLVVPSRELAALGRLAPSAQGEPALLYLNESVDIDHLALERWSTYFDFGGGVPYRRYRTLEPARVNWNASAEHGVLLEQGTAEAV